MNEKDKLLRTFRHILYLIIILIILGFIFSILILTGDFANEHKECLKALEMCTEYIKTNE